MVYKKKVILLSSLVGFLAVVYLITLFFDPERVSSRNAAFLWLDQKLQDQADGIDLARAGEWENPLRLVRRGSNWYALIGESEFPAKNVRVEDLFRILSARAAYPVRGSDASSHERLGLSENQAGRILVRGGAGLPLLDLLIGGSDAAGREVYMRKNGQNEIRSGEDKLSAYITGPETSWYRLGLFAESPSPPYAAMVQSVTVYPLPPEEEEGVPPESPPPEPSEPVVISRNGTGWTIAGMDDETVDAQRVDSYVRGILEAEGDNFIPGLSSATAGFNDGRILVEMGNGSSLAINVGIQPENQKAATATGSPYVYTLADWTVTRLFREKSYFVK